MKTTPKNRQVQAHFARYVLPTYRRLPISFVRGSGVWLWDADGRKYLDCLSGLAVCNLGHGHKQLARVLSNQAARLIHCSNLYGIPQQAELARHLVKLSGLSGAFFCNSGAESIEAAIKFARTWGLQVGGGDKLEIIVFSNAFHGRTWAALSATANEAYKTGFGPLVSDFTRIAYNDVAALKQAINHRTCAILLELIQGEGGVYVASKALAGALTEIQKNQQVLLMIDEVQTGAGRTGRYFSYQHFGLKPDLVCLAKGVAGGLPMGVCLASDRVREVITPGLHASTFGGNPLVAAAALKTLEIVSRRDFLKRVSDQGRFLMNSLKGLQKKYPIIQEIRGMGLLVGIELSQDRAPEIVSACLDRGLLVNGIRERIIRLAPPLIIARQELTKVLMILEEVLGAHG